MPAACLLSTTFITASTIRLAIDDSLIPVFWAASQVPTVTADNPVSPVRLSKRLVSMPVMVFCDRTWVWAVAPAEPVHWA